MKGKTQQWMAAKKDNFIYQYKTECLRLLSNIYMTFSEAILEKKVRLYLGMEERMSAPSGETQAGLCSKFKWNFLRNLRLQANFLSLNMLKWKIIYIRFSVN